MRQEEDHDLEGRYPPVQGPAGQDHGTVKQFLVLFGVHVPCCAEARLLTARFVVLMFALLPCLQSRLEAFSQPVLFLFLQAVL